MDMEITTQVVFAGDSYTAKVKRDSEHPNPYQITLPPGNAGTLSVRGGNTAGTVALSNGHGIATNDIVDVHWPGFVQHGCTATVTGNNVAIASGSGTNLPALNSAVVLTKQVVRADVPVNGDGASYAAVAVIYTDVNSTEQAHVNLKDGSAGSVYARLLKANHPKVYDLDGQEDNPFDSAAITNLTASNGSADEECILYLGFLEDPT